VLLVLICFALGGGTQAVIIAVAFTHWPRLTRILRAEILQIMTSDYVSVSRRFGKTWGFIARRHLIPLLMPQLLVGFLLLFPHAILHEAGLTFLGFGLEPSKPAIGVLLSESMRSLTAGYWWLGVFPGLALVLVVLAFDGLADGVRAISSPRSAQD
jgi:peptide/nickel transport system permease protein